MIMTAVLTLFGLSTCATLFIVAAVAVRARSTVLDSDAASYEAECAPETGKTGSVVPAFSH